MRLLTFQSKEVLKTILQNGIYFADNNLCREKRDYQVDINQLGGFNPIWCFASTKGRDFMFDDFVDGELLERFRCEMSLDQETGLTNFMMLELDVNDNDVFTGITHNAYDGAKVIPSIRLEQVKAIYRVINTTHWYYKNIRLLRSFNGDDILFPYNLSTLKRKIVDGVVYEIYTDGIVGKRKVQHYIYVNSIMVPVTVNKVSYEGDFYTVTSNDGNVLEVETVYVRVGV